MIDHLLTSTHFTLKDIANHTGTPVSTIRSIYLDQKLPKYFSSEIALVKLYQIIIEIQLNKDKLHSASV